MTQDLIFQIPLDQLHESPFNPRKTFLDIEDLAANILAEGRVHSPLLVRPRIFAQGLARRADGRQEEGDTHEGYELVFGHRRLRAAQMARLLTVPCMVRAMTDEEAKRAQLSENLQRRDVHPIEEAEGFHALMQDHGFTGAQVADKVGKSESYVYARVRLLDAVPEVRGACLDGELGSESALLLARLRTPELQAKALARIKAKYLDMKDGGKASFRRIRDLLNEEFTLELERAPFDPADETLLPLAGTCTACPKRTGNAPEYADVVAAGDTLNPLHPDYEERANARAHMSFSYGAHVGADVCTDPGCFADKKKAQFKRQADELTAKGKQVVDGNRARQAVSARGEVGGAYIALADVQDELAAARRAAQKDPKVVPPQVVTIQDPRTGKTVEAVKREELKAAGVKVAEAAPKKKDWQAEQRRRQEQHAKEEALAKTEGGVRVAILNAVRAAAQSTDRSAFDLQLVAHVAFAGVDYYDRGLLASLYGGGSRDDVHKRIGSMGAAEVAMFALTCALVQDVHTHTGNFKRMPAPLLAAAKHYGIDVDAIRREVVDPKGSASTPTTAAQAKNKGAKGKAAPTKPAAQAAKKTGKANKRPLSLADAGAPEEPELRSGKRSDNAGSAGGAAGQIDAFAEATP